MNIKRKKLTKNFITMYNFIIVILERVAKGEQEFWAGKCKLLPTKVLLKQISNQKDNKI